MGLFADLGIDMDAQEESSFSDPEAGWYAFETSQFEVINGTSKDESVVKARLTYALYNDDGTPAGEKQEWWTLFENYDEVTEAAEKGRSILKGRLHDLGVTKSLNEIVEADVEGIRGTLRLVQKGDYTNVRNVKVEDAAPAPKATTARTPAKAAPKTGARPNPFKKS